MKILVTLTLILTAGFVNAQSQNLWIFKDSIKGSPRSAASAFVVDGRGFVMGGEDDNGPRRKMHAYTFWMDDWDAVASIGESGSARSSATTFAIEDKGYICLGKGATNGFFQDLWEYDPVTDAWTQKATFLGSMRRMSVGFAIDSLAYVGLGIDATGFKDDMYKYSPATNSWTQLNDFPGAARKEAVGFAMGGQGYVGTGDSGVLLNDFWQYEPTTDTWVQKADFPGTKRKGAVGWGIFPQAFITTGEDIGFNYTSDLWEYNYFSDTWVQRSNFIGPGRSNAIAFVLQDIAFVGSGYNNVDLWLDDVYSYNRVLNTTEVEQYENVVVYPNPSSNEVSVKVDPTDLSLELMTIDGKTVTNKVDIQSDITGFHFNKGELPAGNYFIRLSHEEMGNVYQEKVIFL